MSLAKTVELYRACGRPALDGAHFCGEIDFRTFQSIVQSVDTTKSGRFDQLDIDGNDALDGQLPSSGEIVKFRFRLATSSSARFHPTLMSLLEVDRQISRGIVPEDYYIVEDDYYSSDTERPYCIDSLERVCRLIRGLAGLAHYHDEKSSTGYMRMVFLYPEKGISARPVELDTKVTPALVSAASDLDPRLVEELCGPCAPNDSHHSAKVGVFGTSLAGFVGRRTSDNAFEDLVRNWALFVEEYQRDLSTYLSGFAFHKAKLEVAEAELKIAGEFSKVLTDITGKLLSIPVSVAAVIAIPRTDTFSERILLFFGFLLASMIVSRTVGNQKSQFDRIVNAKNLVLGAIEGKKDTYPSELASAIDKLGEKLASDEKSLKKNLRFFRVMSWLPVCVAAYAIGYLYWDSVIAFLLGVFEKAGPNP